MITFPRRAAMVVFVGSAIVLSGCSQVAPGASTSTGAKVDISAAQKIYDSLKAIPKFVAPGPAFDAKLAAGKSIFYIPLSSGDQFDALITEASVRAAKAAGVKITVYANQGQVPEWVQGINTAIAQKANVIVLEGAPDTALLGPQIAAAKAAGISVISTHLYDSSFAAQALKDYPGLAAIVPANHYEGGMAMAVSAIVNTGGHVNALFISSNEVQPSAGIAKAYKDELAKQCPDTCKATVINIPISDWATKVQGTVQTALLRDPKINVISPVFDSMTQYISAGVMQAGASGHVKITAYNGNPSVLQMIQKKNLVVSDAGEPTEWLGWANIDQALRILVGVPPLTTENTPLRMFDASNVSDAGVPAVQTKGYGDSSGVTNGYLKLWGLG